MRFCPFCAHELQEDAVHCAFCGKHLTALVNEGETPPLPTGRAPAEDGSPKKTIFGYAAPMMPPALARPLAPAAPPSAPAARPAAPAAPASPRPAPAPASAPSAPASAPPAPASVPPSSAYAPTMMSPGGLLTPEGTPDAALAPGMPAEPAAVPPAVAPPLVVPPAVAPAPSAPRRPPSALASMQALPPMPASAPPGALGGLTYFFRVLGARWRRTGVVGAFQREIAAENRRVDDLLRELGRVARKLELRGGPVEGALDQVRALESQCAQAEASQSELTQRARQEEQAFAERNADCTARITAAQQEITRLQAEQSARLQEQRTLRVELAAVEKELGGSAKQRDARRSLAGKATDAAERQDLEQAAAELGVAMGETETRHKAVQEELAALDGPLSSLAAALGEARAGLQQAQKDLTVARQQLATAKAQASAEERKASLEQSRVQKELGAALLEVGRLVDSSRSSGAGFDELHASIDEVRQGIGEREARIAELQRDREIYDREAMSKGKVLFLVLLGAFLAITVTLIVLFAFVF